MTELSLASRLRTNQGLELPRLGLGVFQVPPGEATRTAVGHALRAGYRLIDTAAMYGNEADVGEAVRASGVPREEVVVTTKLWHTEHGFEPALAAGRKSFERLGLGPIDLYLIHWPRAESPQQRRESWRALERLKKDGIVRSIGVSNYSVRHLEELATGADTPPSVDQVEFHPFVYDPDLLGYCGAHDIAVEAYSPLTRSRRLDDPRFAPIARAHGRTPAQVLLRWGLQHGLVELPRSVREERIRENASVFDFSLTPAEMAALDGLRDGGRVTAWDPATIP
jgi:diketogulonate reductase-like aldo/keto reductase